MFAGTCYIEIQLLIIKGNILPSKSLARKAAMKQTISSKVIVECRTKSLDIVELYLFDSLYSSAKLMFHDE